MGKLPKRGHPIPVRLDNELKADLQRLATADARSLSAYVYLVLRKHVDEVKAAERAAGRGRRKP
jgi:hypothetical protein